MSCCYVCLSVHFFLYRSSFHVTFSCHIFQSPFPLISLATLISYGVEYYAMKIRIFGDKVLAETAKPVEITPELVKLLDEMVPFMRSARGVGLAAPQIGISGRFFVMDAGDKVRKVINPEIVSFGSNQIEMDEGCLSLPGVHRKVRRPKKINVRYTSETGEVIEEELKNLPARVFQHEFDHLNGTVFTDRLGPIQKKMVSGELERLRKRSEAGETLSADDSYAIRSSESFPDYIKVSSAADLSSESENKE